MKFKTTVNKSLMFESFLETLSFTDCDVVYNFKYIYICLVQYFDIVDIINFFF